MTFTWHIARTQAHLQKHTEEGTNYAGISISLKNPPAPEVLEALHLPPLPRKGG